MSVEAGQSGVGGSHMKLGRLERIETMAMKREMQEDRIDLISAGALI